MMVGVLCLVHQRKVRTHHYYDDDVSDDDDQLHDLYDDYNLINLNLYVYSTQTVQGIDNVFQTYD
uniref:CPXV020 protein n=1 Tax=Schistosoma curassoni TaxID=6186 RepID=A0A183KBF8_9TREM